MYRIVKGLLYLFSLQPFFILYGYSNVLYFFVYNVFGYRKQLVLDQLRIAFPEKSEAELVKTSKQFFKNLCDSIVETIKLMSISRAELNKRMTANWDEINQWHAQGRIVQGHLSHLFNWEWGIVICNWNTPYQFAGTYNPLSSKIMDKIMLETRSRSGTICINMNEFPKHMASMQANKNLLWGFIADQNPSEPRRGYWTQFMNRDTVFNKGAEMVARRYDNVVIFGCIKKVKRGYYNIELETIFEHGGQTADGEITEAYAQYLEQKIRQQADNWVWSHRRWKHKRS
jgi:Kdo2-lipid IVA lauroyltransferase/acyltransferase